MLSEMIGELRALLRREHRRLNLVELSGPRSAEFRNVRVGGVRRVERCRMEGIGDKGLGEHLDMRLSGLGIGRRRRRRSGQPCSILLT